ncbi:MAG: hypothetical protein JXJ17_13770 [Anaerolineae bacterium]|nr:hypothetical protein [Anaerolineae bacterium]
MLAVITAILIFLGILLIASIIGLISNLRVYRKATYFTVRRDSARKVRRWFIVLIIAIGGMAAGFRLRNIHSDEEGPPSDITTPASPTVESLPIATIDPSLTPKDLREAPPTITPTQPTPTQTPTLAIATAETSIEVPEGASLTLTAISSRITANLLPLDPGDSFAAGIPRIYFFFDYENLAQGVSWSQVLLYNGEVVRSQTETWTWGAVGKDVYYYFETRGGWPAGVYEVQFYLGDQLAASKTFTLGD